MFKNTRSKIKNNRKFRGGVDSDSPRSKSSNSPRSKSSDSPRTKSIKKIQATARSRRIRQTKKVTSFNELLSSGAAKYKDKILQLDLKGVNLKGARLSRRVLNGIDLQKVLLTEAKLNGTKLIQANLSRSIFKKVEMNKSDLTKSICKKCHFEQTTLNLTNFSNADLEGSIFIVTTGSGTNFENANLKVCFLKLCSFENNNFKYSNFSGSVFKNCKMEKSDLTRCVLKLCSFEHNNLNYTNFSGSVFENTRKFNNNNMIQSIFTNVNGLSGTLFENNNFTSSSFNGTNLSRVSFINCNLQGCQFIPILPHGARGDFDQIPSDLTNAVFEKCQLQSITFQSTLGLQGRNFQGQDLRRCTFIGCDLTGTIFRDCNLSECDFTNAFITDTDFTGSIRENTVFDEAIGRQQNETLTNAERGIVVEGDDEIPAIYPTDVHAAFKIIKKNEYFHTISSYVNNWKTKKVSDIVKSNDTFTKWASKFLDDIINKISENKYQLMVYKKRCMSERLNFYNYKDNIVIGSQPRIPWLLFLYATLLYVDQQIDEFKHLYVTDVIMESATTYGNGGLSCDRGIIERFIIKLRNTIYMMMDLPQIKNNIDKVIEFNKILNTIDPTKTLPTTRDAIEAEREAPEREYIDFTVSQEMREEWFKIHKAGGSEPFNEDTEINKAMDSYKNFLKQKFNYTNLDRKDQNRYDKEMIKEIYDMRVLLYDADGMTYLFSGGRKMRGGHGGFWEMGEAKFRILCRKIFGKTKCKKMRNTKKLKKLKRKETRRN